MTGTALAKTAVHAGGAVAAIVPRSLDEAYRLATALASSGLAPRGFERPEQIMVAVMAGAELGLAPYQSMQSFAVINGRATMWGDSLVAVVRAHGCRIKEAFENEAPTFPDAMTAVCEVTRPDGEVIRATFSVADAKLAGLWGKKGRNGEPTPWITYPKRMLKNRARAFALRDGCADMLRGVQVREEVEDYVTEAAPPRASAAIGHGTGMRARLEARSAEGGFDADHVSAELDRVLEGDDIPAEFDEIADPNIDPPADDIPARDDTPPEAAREPEEAKNPSGELPLDTAALGFKTGAQLQAEQDAAFLKTWASDLTDEVGSMDAESLKALLADPESLDRFARLDATAPEVAKALNRTISRRQKELGA